MGVAMIKVSTEAAHALAQTNQELYTLHDDGSESLVEIDNITDFDKSLQYGIEGELFGEPYHDDVKVRIRFVDDGTEQTVFIRQSHDMGDDDDSIFFYGMSRQSIVDAAKSGEVIENEWVITEVL